MSRDVAEKALPSTQDTVCHQLRNIAAADAVPIAKKFSEGNQLRVALTTDPETNAVHVAGDAHGRQMVVQSLASLDDQPTQVLVQVLVVQVPTGFLADLGLTDDRLRAPVLTLTPRELDALKVQIRRAKFWGTVEVLSHSTVQCRDNQHGFIEACADCPELATRPALEPGLTSASIECTWVGAVLNSTARVL
jgi:hypothetical protein